MEVNIINGDVLKSGSPIIAHQVNCMGIMGGGVALQVKKKYPVVFNKYLNLVESTSDKLALLGTTQFVECGDTIVANLFGQYSIGGGVQTRYNEFRSCIVMLREYMIHHNIKEVAFPYLIGCYRGGGDWTIVDKIIREEFESTNISVNYYSFSE